MTYGAMINNAILSSIIDQHQQRLRASLYAILSSININKESLLVIDRSIVGGVATFEWYCVVPRLHFLKWVLVNLIFSKLLCVFSRFDCLLHYFVLFLNFIFWTYFMLLRDHITSCFCFVIHC